MAIFRPGIDPLLLSVLAFCFAGKLLLSESNYDNVPIAKLCRDVVMPHTLTKKIGKYLHDSAAESSL